MITKQIRRLFGFTSKIEHADTNANILKEKGDSLNINKLVLKEQLRRSADPIIIRCMDLIARNISSIKMVINESCFTGLKALFDQPNEEDDQMQFIEKIVLSILRTGFTYVLLETINDRLCMRCIDHDLVSAKIIKNGVAGFMVRGVFIKEEFLLIIKDTTQHYSSTARIVSKCELARHFADLRQALWTHNHILIRNTPKQSGALIIDRLISDRENAHIREEIEKLKMEHIPLFPKDTAWVNIADKPRELDYLNSLRDITQEIIVIFGIPVELINKPGAMGYYAYRFVRRHWFEDEILPFTNRIRSALEKWLNQIAFQFFGIKGQITITLDTSEIPGFNDANAEAFERDQLKADFHA